jgi:hypothetical protein
VGRVSGCGFIEITSFAEQVWTKGTENVTSNPFEDIIIQIIILKE